MTKTSEKLRANCKTCIKSHNNKYNKDRRLACDENGGVLVLVDQKNCGVCKVNKSAVDFNKHKISKDGLKNECKTCERLYTAKWRKDNKEYKRLKDKEWRENNPERCKANSKNWAQRNKARIKINQTRWNEENKDHVIASKREWSNKNRDHIKARNRRWLVNNRAKFNANIKKRKCMKLNATPPWYYLVKYEVEAVYAEAKRLEEVTGIPHHVDHIVPLQHKLVCGLHVPCNLRPIPAIDNMRKHNTFVPYVESNQIY
jgi:hypothetical protein